MESVLKDGFMVSAIIIVIAIVVGCAAHFVSKTNDSPLEEAAEAVIENQLNLPNGTIDLSPGGDNI